MAFNRTTLELKRRIIVACIHPVKAFNRTTLELKRTEEIAQMKKEFETFNRTTLELKLCTLHHFASYSFF